MIVLTAMLELRSSEAMLVRMRQGRKRYARTWNAGAAR
jgi:hypothetical protein